MKKKIMLYFLIFLSVCCGVMWSILGSEQSKSEKELNIAILDSGINPSEMNVTHHDVVESQISSDEYGHGTGGFMF